ncbi:MAG TPA: dTDP-4-dehydrorhamnose 3,5-epimerase [Polyangiaceae bacterium]|nr:dTDP-4-dehydrorhamnose 3,5-epimerase [Polyangiaceae bacterium]
MGQLNPHGRCGTAAAMRVTPTELPEVVVVEPQIFGDSRGYFVESWNQARYRDAGLPALFVQDNLSLSRRGVLRGLHFQYPKAQGKLITVLEGTIFDVAVDIRAGSPRFGKVVTMTLSGDNKRQIYIPPGFAHGFAVVSESALFMYKCTELYAPEAEGGIIWNDPDLGIRWPIEAPALSARDETFPRLRDLDRSRLSPYQENAADGGDARR